MLRWVNLLFLLALFSNAVVAQNIAPVTLAPAVTNTTSYGTWHVDTADFNNDGNIDAVFGDYSGASHVYLGNGTGAFTEITNFVGNAKRTWVADFNKDGNSDFVAAYSTNAGVALGQGNGSFVYSNYVTGGSDFYLVVGDFDSDGYEDLITTSNRNVTVLRNKGDGTFETATNINFIPRSDIPFPVLGDFDNDGTNDLLHSAVSTPYSDIYYRKGLGGGTFGPSTVYRININIRSINAAHLNGDRNLDLIALSESGRIHTLIGDGTGNFLVNTNSLGFKSIPSPPALADFNGDGALDFAVVYYFDKAINVFLNDGSGNFPTVVTNRNVDLAQTAAAADFNNDGKPDIIGTRYDPKGYTVFLNLTAPSLAPVKLSNTLEILWPNWVGYNLVTASSVDSVIWLPVTNTVSIVNGKKRVELPTEEEQQFFRLRKD